MQVHVKDILFFVLISLTCHIYYRYLKLSTIINAKNEPLDLQNQECKYFEREADDSELDLSEDLKLEQSGDETDEDKNSMRNKECNKKFKIFIDDRKNDILARFHFFKSKKDIYFRLQSVKL